LEEDEKLLFLIQLQIKNQKFKLWPDAENERGDLSDRSFRLGRFPKLAMQQVKECPVGSSACEQLTTSNKRTLLRRIK
jgi:hypothetical protein